MNILRVPQSQCLFVIASEETDAFIPDGVEQFRQFLEASVGKVIEAWEKSGVHTFYVKPFVADVNVLSVISHAYPESMIEFFYFSDGVTKSIQVAGPGSEMYVPDGE